jgi:GH15 family glucan-1,4-alpha-glucosidase
MTNPRDASPQVTAELLLQVFDLPVSFHRCLVPITGGITAALMLSQAIWTTQELDPEANGWFIKSQEEWTEDTGLSRWEQETARRALRSAGLLEERRVGMPAKLWYRVRPDHVWQALRDRAASVAANRNAGEQGRV